MSDSLRVWVGPVSRAQVQARAQDVVYPCTGDGAHGSHTCRAWAAAHPLAELVAGVDGPFQLCAFSAGAQAVKQWAPTITEALQARIEGLYLFDGLYETQREHADPGLVAWCVRAAQRETVFFASVSSSPNKTYGSGSEVAGWLRAAVARELDQSWTEFESLELEGLKPARAAYVMGNAVIIDWDAIYQHGDHPVLVAPTVLESDLIPLFGPPAQGHGDPQGPGDRARWPFMVGVAGACVGVIGAIAIAATLHTRQRRREEQR